MRKLDFKMITKNIGVYGLSQAIAAFSALIRLPIAIGYLGISEFGKMVSVIQVLSVPLLFQGAMRLHFRKKFTQNDFDGVASFIELQRRLIKFSLRKFIFPLVICLVLSSMLASKFFARDRGLNITVTIILILLFISIIPTAIHYGYLDSKSQQNSVILIDIVSSVVSVPFLFAAVYFELSMAFVLCIFTSTLWSPIFVLIYLTRNQKSKSKIALMHKVEEDFHFSSYLKQSFGSSLTLNYNSVLFALQTNPILVAKVNIAEKLLSSIFIPTAALAPTQFVKLTKISSIHNEKTRRTRTEILLLNVALTVLFSIPVVLASYFFSPLLMNESAGLSLGMILSIAFAYCIFSIYSTLQLMNLARLETSTWILNMGIMLGLISTALCYVLAAKTKDLTLLFSIGSTYLVGSSILLLYFFRKAENP